MSRVQCAVARHRRTGGIQRCRICSACELLQPKSLVASGTVECLLTSHRMWSLLAWCAVHCLIQVRPHLLQEHPCWCSSYDSDCVAPAHQVLANLYGACGMAQTVPSAVVCNGEGINCSGCTSCLSPRTCTHHGFKLLLLRPCAGTRELQAYALAPLVSCRVVSTVPHMSDARACLGGKSADV